MTPRTVHAVGLDVSLASTGVAVLGCTPRREWTAHSYTIPTTGKAGDPEAALLDRMIYLTAHVAEATADADVIVMEGGAFAARGAHQHTLAGCWWLVYRRVMGTDTPVVIVPPATVKRYATGRGNADKAAVGMGVGRMWPDADIRGSDAIDALALASIGADLLDLPVPYARTNYRADVLATLPQLDEDAAA